jgi:hypothetical protein
MSFKDTRRQKYLAEASYEENRDAWIEDVANSRKILVTEELTPKAQKSFRWSICSEGLELLILHYTGGRPIEELRAQLPQVIEDFDIYIANERSPRSENPPRAVADTLEITQVEAFVYVFWLLALCKLLKHDEFIPKVMSWVDKTYEFNRGRDILFENVVQALTGNHVPSDSVLFHPNPYRPLARATFYPQEERAALVKDFVESWYKGMKPTYWYGSHKDGIYFGYWCFEAALVTVLFDIDDSSYRDHLVYPRDLVDWYRANSPASPRNTPPPRPMLKAMPGEPCPQSGEWFAPFLKKTVRVQQGEPMPGPELDQSRNTITWYLTT